MSKAALDTVKKALTTDLHINYQYGRWDSKVVYPYWTGELQETPTQSEDGLQESVLKLQGHSRSGVLPLENDKEAMEQLFNPISGYKVTTDNGNVVAIFYGNSQHIKSVDAELKRIEVELQIKEWKVNI